MAPILYYLESRCLAHPIRLLLHYTGTEFEDKMYPVGPAPDYDKKEWKADKFSIGLDFPNLPYYIDGDVKISQSKAILRYLGWKYDMCGNTPQERAKVEMLAEQANEVHWEFIYFTYYHYDEEDAKKKFMDSLPDKMKAFSQFLGEKTYFISEKISYADILMYEVLAQHLYLAPNCLDSFKNLKNFQTRFESHPNIKKFMSSPNFHIPINNKYAKFGNKI